MELTATAGRPGHYKLLVEPQAMGRLIGREGTVVKALRLLIGRRERHSERRQCHI
jgi:predicted RNA-binding protein YlqC (UPF0109 family)